MILLLIIIILALLILDSNVRLVTSKYELSYTNLPEMFIGYRIAVLSDVHAAEFGQDNEKLIAKVKAEAPDIIAITGDLISYVEELPIDAQLEIAESLARELVRIAPVYYITGNHDWDRRLDGPWALIEILREQGVHILRNQYEVIESRGDAIILAGVDDPNGPVDMTKPDEFIGKIAAAEGERFTVVLVHRNHHLQLYSVLGADLVLSGHAHGGIIRLPFTDGLIGPLRDWFPTYTSGVYSIGDTNMVVSRGIGNRTGLPRFLNNPEIVIVTLSKQPPP